MPPNGRQLVLKTRVGIVSQGFDSSTFLHDFRAYSSSSRASGFYPVDVGASPTGPTFLSTTERGEGEAVDPRALEARESKCESCRRDQLLWCNGEHVGFSPRRSRFDSGQECHFQNAPVRYVVGDQAFNLANRVQIPAGVPLFWSTLRPLIQRTGASSNSKIRDSKSRDRGAIPRALATKLNDNHENP